MKRTLVVVVAVAVVLIGSASAGTFPRMRVNVPFAFHAGNQIIPSGEYLLELRSMGAAATGSTLYILNRDRMVVHILPATPGTRAGNSDNYLLFNRYGQEYFLSKACQGTYEATAPKGRAEREIALAYAKSQQRRPVIVAAAGR